MSYLNKRDRFLYPIEITTDNRTLKIVDYLTARTFHVGTAGLYYAYGGLTEALPFANLSGFKGIYSGLNNVMDEISTSQNYKLISVLPTESTADGTRRAIGLHADGGLNFSIDWDNSTIDPRLLGFPADITGTTSNDGKPVIVGPHEPIGMWTPFYTRAYADRNKMRHIVPSSDQVSRDNFHQTDYGSTSTRLLKYPYNPAANIINGKAYSDTYGDNAKIYQDWASFERLWEAMARREDILIQYEMDPIRLWLGTHEVVRLKDHKAAQEFRQNFRRMNLGGETYEVEMLLERVQGVRND